MLLNVFISTHKYVKVTSAGDVQWNIEHKNFGFRSQVCVTERDMSL
jgi:hypothetical protein